MKKLLIIAFITLGNVVSAQVHNLIYKDFQDFDSIKATYKVAESCYVPIEINFNTSTVRLGFEDKMHADFDLVTYTSSNNSIIYQCYNKTSNRNCIFVLYVYGDYRYLDIIYSTNDKFRYRTRIDDPVSYKN